MKPFLFFFIFFTGCASAKPAPAPKAIVFFDLGNTLVNVINFSDPAAKTHYLSGVREYLHSLKDTGYEIGMISNIPDSWGATKQEKIATLHKKIQDRWSEAAPFDWDLFGDRVLVPVGNDQFKPAPALYLQADAISKAQRTHSIYIGDDAPEVDAAKAVGFEAYLVVPPSPKFPNLN